LDTSEVLSRPVADIIEMLKKRKETLIIERQRTLDNVNAFNGAIQECDYWLEVIKND